jgi:hypothetical protein
MMETEEKCCGWCEKFNTSECTELFVNPDKEDVCENMFMDYLLTIVI